MYVSLEKIKQSNFTEKWSAWQWKVWMMELSQYRDLGADKKGFPCLWPHILTATPCTRIWMMNKALVRRTLLIFFSKLREWSKQKIILTEKKIIFCPISSLNWSNRKAGIWSQNLHDCSHTGSARYANCTLRVARSQAEVMLLQGLYKKFTLCKPKPTDDTTILFETPLGKKKSCGFRGDRSQNYASKPLAFYVVRWYHLFM